MKGMTLLEVMITIVIIGIIAAVAYPSYLSYMQNSRRADAMQSLMNSQSIYEKCYSSNFSYTGCSTQLPATSSNGYYLLSASSSTSTYTITATATGIQTSDINCQSFAINQAGIKTAKNNANSDATSTCWPQ